MIVFGGNTHTDTQCSQGSKCYSKEFIAYDIHCDTWLNLEHTIPRNFSADLARYGHSAVSYNNSIYFYGGFNGQVKNDIVRFTPGKCEHVKNMDDCMASMYGVKCVWNKKKELCEIWGLEHSEMKNSVEICFEESRNTTAFCRAQKSCPSCLANTGNSVWCSDGCHSKRCPQGKDGMVLRDLKQCSVPESNDICKNEHTCNGCLRLGMCWWSENGQCVKKKATVRCTTNSNEEGSRNRKEEQCPLPCSARESCKSCTSGLCMWCHSLQTCIDRNSYLVNFPYGKCMDWTTHYEKCPLEDNKSLVPNICRRYDSCSDCVNNPACGWCNEGNKNGLGKCHEGGFSGPLLRRPVSSTVPWMLSDSSNCSVDNTWDFISCPDCQCNGHSTCSSPGVCDQPCQHNTQGDHCQSCSDGFFGNPGNGGKCSKCQCNEQGTLCDHKTGRCYCTTKGE